MHRLTFRGSNVTGQLAEKHADFKSGLYAEGAKP